MLDDADTFVNQATLKKFRHVSIFSWQKLIATLDDRQLHAESAECLREFATDRAAAEHDHALRLSFSSSKTVSFVKYGTSLMPSIFGIAGRLPVAMTKFLARSFCPFTSTSFGDTNRA